MFAVSLLKLQIVSNMTKFEPQYIKISVRSKKKKNALYEETNLSVCLLVCDVVSGAKFYGGFS